MADLEIVGCCWVELPAASYKIVTQQKETLCQIEVLII